MADKGYIKFSVIFTSIIVAIITILLIIFLLDLIFRRSNKFGDFIYHIDLVRRLINLTFEKHSSSQYLNMSKGTELSELGSGGINRNEQQVQEIHGGCGGSCYSLSSSLTYDPQIFLKKRMQ